MPGRERSAISCHPVLPAALVQGRRAGIDRVLRARFGVEVPVVQADGGAREDDIVGEFESTDVRLPGQDAAGSWAVRVAGTAAADAGTLDSRVARPGPLTGADPRLR